jgi:unsaturated rhamnogalacturonyl hydrolase
MKPTLRFLLPLLGLALLAETGAAQTAQPAAYSQRMADAFISWHPDSIVIGKNKTARWDYEHGPMLRALERVWQRTGDPKYFAYIKQDLASLCGPMAAFAPMSRQILTWMTSPRATPCCCC